MKGSTKAGFKFEVSENIGKDFRIVMAMRKVSSDDLMEKVAGTYDFAEAILGKSGIDQIVQFAIEQKGYADSEFIMDQCNEIVAIVNEKSASAKK
jgi:hypothetical protein